MIKKGSKLINKHTKHIVYIMAVALFVFMFTINSGNIEITGRVSQTIPPEQPLIPEDLPESGGIFSTCAIGDTLFRVTDTRDAQAGPFDYNPYPYKVCFPDAGPIRKVCTLPEFPNAEFSLFLINRSVDNHYIYLNQYMNQYNSNDFYDVCSPDVACYFEEDENKECANSACLFRISDTKDGAVAECNVTGGKYPIKACCNARDIYPEDPCSKISINDMCGALSCRSDIDNDGWFNSDNQYPAEISVPSILVESPVLKGDPAFTGPRGSSNQLSATKKPKLHYIENNITPVKVGESFIVSANGWTRVFNYENYSNDLPKFKDYSTRQSRVGTLVVDGYPHDFKILNSAGDLLVDLDGDGIINRLSYVDISTSASSYSTKDLFTNKNSYPAILNVMDTPAVIDPYNMTFISKSGNLYSFILQFGDEKINYYDYYGCDEFPEDGCSISQRGDRCVSGCGPSYDDYCQALTTPIAPAACQITDARWSAISVASGQNINLIIDTNDGCNGQAATFNVYEVDLIGTNPVNVNPSSVVVSNNNAVSVWAAEYQDDISGNPEYEFEVTIGSATFTSSNQLTVSPSATGGAPFCGDGNVDSGERCNTCAADAGCNVNEICCEDISAGSASCRLICGGSESPVQPPDDPPACKPGLVPDDDGRCVCDEEGDDLCINSLSACLTIDPDCEDGDGRRTGINPDPDGDGVCDFIISGLSGTVCSGIDLCPGTPASQSDSTDLDGCSDEEATCRIQWDCSKVLWNPCNNGIKKRDVGDCTTLGIQSGLCRCVAPGTESCLIDGVYRPPTQEACFGGDETEFPFFTNLNILITVILIAGFYLARRKHENQ